MNIQYFLCCREVALGIPVFLPNLKQDLIQIWVQQVTSPSPAWCSPQAAFLWLCQFCMHMQWWIRRGVQFISNVMPSGFLFEGDSLSAASLNYTLRSILWQTAHMFTVLRFFQINLLVHLLLVSSLLHSKYPKEKRIIDITRDNRNGNSCSRWSVYDIIINFSKVGFF